MEITDNLTDDTILAELGSRIEKRRLALQLTQANLAEQAGVSKRTVERIEAGASAQMSSMVRILRVLETLTNLNQLLPEPEPRPMDLLKRRGQPRQRASGAKSASRAVKAWSWDEDA